MPKITDTPSLTKRIFFPGDFKETLDEFEKVIKLDPEVLALSGPIQKTSGYLSLGIRVAMKFYLYGHGEETKHIPGREFIYKDLIIPGRAAYHYMEKKDLKSLYQKITEQEEKPGQKEEVSESAETTQS